MSEREQEEEKMTDPPVNQGGGNRTDLESPEEPAPATDPPVNNGGGN